MDKVQEYECLLTSILSVDDFSKFVCKHQIFFKKFCTDLGEAKRRKWASDRQDYQTGYVSSWNLNKNLTVPKRYRKVNDTPKIIMIFLTQLS